MQYELTKLERAVGRLSVAFLGVVEDETTGVIGKKKLDLKIVDMAEFTRSLGRKPRTQCVEHLLNETIVLNGGVDLRFTDTSMLQKLNPLGVLKIIRVIDMAKERLGRTILEVDVSGERIVLKVVNAMNKVTINDSIHTPTETEVHAFDMLPTTIKPLFVKKYAHGRLFLNEYTPEVILMEKMFPVDMQHLVAVTNRSFTLQDKMGWWVKAIESLLKIHRAGFFHGDCHLGNILFTDDLGKGNLKWIDPERMISINGLDEKTKAAYALQEIYHILIHNLYVIVRTNLPLDKMDFGKLSDRLFIIKNRLNTEDRKNFMLPEMIIFDQNIRGNGGQLDKVFMDAIKMGSIRMGRQNQYDLLGTVDYDSFLEKLTNVYYLENVVEYLINQFNKAKLGDMSVRSDDLTIPSTTPSSRMQSSPPVLVTPPKIVPNNGPGIYPPPAAPPMPGPFQPAQGAQIQVIRLELKYLFETLKLCNENGWSYGFWNNSGTYQLCHKVNNQVWEDCQSLGDVQMYCNEKGKIEPLANDKNMFYMRISGTNLLMGFVTGNQGAYTFKIHKTIDLTQREFRVA